MQFGKNLSLLRVHFILIFFQFMLITFTGNRMERPSITLASADWRFQVIKVWLKNLDELPIATDLLKILPQLTIVNLAQTHSPPQLRDMKKDDKLEAIFSYTSHNFKMSTGDIDLSFKKKDIFTLIEQV